jgi:hypothetical protein
MDWSNRTSDPPVNDSQDASSSFGISTEGVLGVPTAMFEDGIGMRPNGALTFDLDEVRAAGGWNGTPLRFISEHVGLNDTAVGVALNNASIRVAVIVSDATNVLAGYSGGMPVPVVKTGNEWSFIEGSHSFLVGDGRYEAFDVPLPPAARFLTLVVTDANLGGDTSDFAVFSGARLIRDEELSSQLHVFQDIGKSAPGSVLTTTDADTVISGPRLDTASSGHLFFQKADQQFFTGLKQQAALPDDLFNGRKTITTSFWLDEIDFSQTGFNDGLTILGGNDQTGQPFAYSIVLVPPRFEFDQSAQIVEFPHGFIQVTQSAGESAIFPTPFPLDDGQPHHFAVVTDGATNEFEVFIDGQSLGRRSLLFGNITPIALGSSGISLGVLRD